ncbi:UbiD family decarboxylase [Serratia entomophila]|uniref:UbiD family decarboxylase n=1 Tax=Serratia entomophila TaxID=42906 RepID=UPI0021795692|nr:UbiD family decarboxylase [Serratia entomophila]CAI0871851.1 3-octaprenyl-4-hydroxybenzoate carboxy-lyase [Serratia entomophila]CAI1513147.1 3-octaprenyl-4-hydroxybenzoate carboxy-lyase [Serratia entomophila]CAI1590666.1 3-octaprenyl-4-hydroxybenzoate carboxy-lyase [Serratia entomophila]CAI1822527.1 3-octaprenyl-4-hydroxybenzoate carboxy-lyase [Serratia entomophila]CAI1884029.1 3-octaprenyl-4-hydroxybenzoate carboxy-lyase [Serratia entomophila]
MLLPHDLRSALALLRQAGDEITPVERSISPEVEMIEDFLDAYCQPGGSWFADEQPLRLYRRPTRGEFPVLMGMFGNRRRCRLFLDPFGRYSADISNAQLLLQAASRPIAPRLLGGEERNFRNVRKPAEILALLPILRYLQNDPGPTVTLGLIYARDNRTGAANCSYHRITFKEDSAVVAIDSRGHLQHMLSTHLAHGEQLPISVNIGLDPAIYLASTLTRPCLSYGSDELGVAGALRGNAVEVAPCHANTGRYIAHAEIVIEGMLGAEKEPETAEVAGFSLPEYLGYRSPCGMATTLEVQAVSHRAGAIYQTLSGPGVEQSILLGLGQECSLLARLKTEGLERLFCRVAALPSGGGHLLTVLQVAKRACGDDLRVIDAAKRLLGEVPSLKNVLLVDEDVDPYSERDVLWAMSTRARLERDIHVSALLPGTSLDPSQLPLYGGSDAKGLVNKCVVDCTVPFSSRRRFQRAF